MAPTVKKCQIEGAGIVQIKCLSEVVKSKNSKGCGVFAITPRFTDPLTCSAEDLGSFSLSHGIQQLDMSFLHGTDDNDSDALQCLPSSLEASSAKYIGQIEESKAKEIKGQPQSRRQKFEKCDKRFRQDQDRGDGRFWWSASVGDVIPAAENCGRCIRATGSGQSSGSCVPIPPEVKSSSPPEMNQESILTHLGGLKKAMGTLPEDLEAQLEKLEEQAKDRMLSHGHLNKLSKLQRQLAALSTRIQEMDSNWKTFAAEVMKRFEEHQQMYKQTRTKLLPDILKKNEELQAAKIEVLVYFLAFRIAIFLE